MADKFWSLSVIELNHQDVFSHCEPQDQTFGRGKKEKKQLSDQNRRRNKKKVAMVRPILKSQEMSQTISCLRNLPTGWREGKNLKAKWRVKSKSRVWALLQQRQRNYYKWSHQSPWQYPISYLTRQGITGQLNTHKWMTTTEAEVDHEHTPKYWNMTNILYQGPYSHPMHLEREHASCIRPQWSQYPMKPATASFPSLV